jgi:hypothetical protein
LKYGGNTSESKEVEPHKKNETTRRAEETYTTQNNGSNAHLSDRRRRYKANFFLGEQLGSDGYISFCSGE